MDLETARANRRLVRTVIAAVAEVGPGILGGDAVERRADRPVQGVDAASRQAAQLALHLSTRPARSGSGRASRGAGGGRGSRSGRAARAPWASCGRAGCP